MSLNSVAGDAASDRKAGLAVAIGLLWALVVVGYPLTSSTTTLLDLPNRMVSVSVRALTVLLALAILVQIGIRGRRLYKGAFWFPIAVFWTLYLLRLAYDSGFAPDNLRLTPIEYAQWAIGGSLLTSLAFMVRLRDNQLACAFDVTLWIGVAGAFAVATLYALSPEVFVDPERLTLATLNPISMGHFGLTVAILAAVGFLTMSGGKLLRPALVYLPPLMLGIAITLAAASRGPLLALALTWILLLLATRTKRAAVFLAATGILIVCTALLVELGTSYAPLSRTIGPGRTHALMQVIDPGGMTKAFGLTPPDSATEDRRKSSPGTGMRPPTFKPLPLARDEVRMAFLADAWAAIKAHPWLGNGIEPLEEYPHNTLVESFLATGMVGGITYAVILLVSAVAAFKVLLADRRHYWIALLYFQQMMLLMVSGSLYGNGAAWCLMAAAVVRASQISWSGMRVTGTDAPVSSSSMRTATVK